METEEEEERLRMRQKKEWQSSPYDKRFGADGRGNDRADRKLAASDCGVLKFVEKVTELTMLVLAIYVERVLIILVVISIAEVVSLSLTAVSAM